MKPVNGWVRVIADSIVGDIEFLAIILSLIIVPLIWVLVRKQNATDPREGSHPYQVRS